MKEKPKDYEKLAAAAKKPWLTQEEAAFYCGVSDSQFRAKRNRLGLTVHNSEFGKLLFSRAELDKIIEAGAWRDNESQSTGAVTAHISIGPRTENVTASHSGSYRSKRQKLLDSLRNSN